MGVFINIFAPILLGFLVGFLLIIGIYFFNTAQKHKHGFKQEYDTEKALASRVNELPKEPEDPLQQKNPKDLTLG